MIIIIELIIAKSLLHVLYNDSALMIFVIGYVIFKFCHGVRYSYVFCSNLSSFYYQLKNIIIIIIREDT